MEVFATISVCVLATIAIVQIVKVFELSNALKASLKTATVQKEDITVTKSR